MVGVVELEQSYQPVLIYKLFRGVQTFIGGGGFFGLSSIADLTHDFEDLLMKVREGELDFNPGMVPTFFAACDALRDMHEADDHGDSLDVSELCKNLKKLQEGEAVEIISEPESDIITEAEEETEPPEVENISEEQNPEEETLPKSLLRQQSSIFKSEKRVARSK